MSRLKETEGGREIRLLKQSQAIQEGQVQTDLTNTIMLRRAKWLLDSIDNYF